MRRPILPGDLEASDDAEARKTPHEDGAWSLMVSQLTSSHQATSLFSRRYINVGHMITKTTMTIKQPSWQGVLVVFNRLMLSIVASLAPRPPGVVDGVQLLIHKEGSYS